MLAGDWTFVVERAGHENPILGVAGSNPIHSKVVLIRGFFLSFQLKKLLCRVIAGVFENSFASV